MVRYSFGIPVTEVVAGRHRDESVGSFVGGRDESPCGVTSSLVGGDRTGRGKRSSNLSSRDSDTSIGGS